MDDHWTLGDLKSVVARILHKTPTLAYLLFTPDRLPFSLNLSLYDWNFIADQQVLFKVFLWRLLIYYFSPTSVVLDFGVRWEGTFFFLRVSMFKTWCLTFWSLYLKPGSSSLCGCSGCVLCGPLAIRLSSCWPCKQESTRPVAQLKLTLASEDLTRLYYLLRKVPTKINKIRNSPCRYTRLLCAHTKQYIASVQYTFQSDTPLRPKCQIIISTILEYVAHTCHLSSTQMVIGAAPVSPCLLSAPLWSLRLATVSDWPVPAEVSTSFPATELLWEANLIRGHTALPDAFQERLLGWK